MFDLLPENWFDLHVEVYRPEDHYHVLGEDARFVPDDDPDTAPDPMFEGMPWITIVQEIDEYEHESRLYEEQWRREQTMGY